MNILHLAISPKQLSQNNCVISMESEKNATQETENIQGSIKKCYECVNWLSIWFQQTRKKVTPCNLEI